MDTIKMSVDAFDNKVGSVLSNYMEKPTLVKGVVHLLLMLYVARIAPIPPKIVLDLFANIYFKLFIFSVVLWTAQFSPSTSILIALAFLVTINYTTTGKLWEMLDNVSSDTTTKPTVQQSAQAVDLLAKAATSSSPSDPATVQTVANVAVANATTPQAVAAIQALAQQAVVPEAGVPAKVAEAVATATTTEPVTPAQSAAAVDLLAKAATSSSPSDSTTVQTVANVAVANANTPQAVAAIQALAQQAVVPEAGAPAKIAEAVAVAKSDITNTPIAPVVPVAPTPIVPTPAQSVVALDLLQKAAESKSPSDVATVQTVANVAAANASSPQAVAAIQALAQQAVAPDAGTPAKVAEAVAVAKSDIVGAGNTALFPEQELAKVSLPQIIVPTATPQETGCYPIRKIDMSAVMGMSSEESSSFEDHATFMASK
jgi:hypothetical protein